MAILFARRAFVVCLGGMLLAGCTQISLPWSDDDENLLGKRPSPAAKSNEPVRVKVDGSGLPQRDDQVALTKSDELLPAVDEFVRAKRGRSVRAFLRQRPDMALEALRESLGEAAAPAALATVAAGYDELLSLDPDRGWTMVVGRRGERADAFRQYAASRKALLEALGTGGKSADLANKLVKQGASLGAPMVMLDAYQMQGIARLLEQEPEEAAEAFAAGHALAGNVDAYQQAQIGLLWSDALRRAGRVDEADRAWESSVSLAANLAGRQPSLFDPVYWDKASYLRPVKKDWPEGVAASLRRCSPLGSSDEAAVKNGIVLGQPTRFGQSDEAEAVVWGAIGRALLERDDCQAALVALKRADAAAIQPSTQGWMQRAQAVALARLNQTPAATAILVRLGAHEDADVVRGATATLGSLRLRQGDTNAGFRLLVKAIEKPDVAAATSWPGMGDAEADLGLAYLMRGEEATGMRWLHAAQERFAAAQDDLSLAKSLWNEEAYLKHKSRKTEAASLRTRLAEHEADGLLTAR